MDKLEKEAWTEWFEKCSIERCSRNARRILSDSISKTLKARRKTLIENGMMDLASNEFDNRALSFFDAYYSIGISYRSDTEKEIKPRKQWLLDNINRGDYTIESTVYGKLLGKDLFTIVREIQNDISQDSHASLPISMSDNRAEGYVLRITANPTHSCDDDTWAIETFTNAFIQKSSNPLMDVELLKTFLLLRGETPTHKLLTDLPKSTLYHKRNQAIQLVKTVLNSNEELSDILKIKGARLFPVILKTIEDKVTAYR